MTIIIKDQNGNIVVEKELDSAECRVDLSENTQGQVQCSIQQTIASIH